jgi:hypothetical protein
VEITFVVTVEEANLILNAVAQLPYAQVASLVAKLREQAEPQLKPGLDE